MRSPVANCTRWPVRQALRPNAVARCVLPVPGGPRGITFLAVEEVELPEVLEVLDHLLLDAALEGEVELLERLARREPGGFDPVLAAVAVTRGEFSCEQRPQELLIAPGFLPCPLGQTRERPSGSWSLQRPEEVRQLRAGPLMRSERHRRTRDAAAHRFGGVGGGACAGARAGSDARGRRSSGTPRRFGCAERRAHPCPGRSR